MKLQVGVKVFLKNSEGKYLILKRNTDTYPDIDMLNIWDIVGGRIDIGETLQENLAREVQEETGLSMTSDPVLLHAQDILRSKEKHVVRLTYVANTAGEPRLDTAENTEYKWLSVAELESFRGLSEYVQEVLKKRLLT